MSTTCYACGKEVDEYMHCVVCDREFCSNCFKYKTMMTIIYINLVVSI